MKAAMRAKSAYARATIAVRMLKTQKRLCRAFDDCFEMYNGDDLVREIRRRSRTDRAPVATLARTAQVHGLNPHELPSMPLLHSFGVF